jgi:hypothetical protein
MATFSATLDTVVRVANALGVEPIELFRAPRQEAKPAKATRKH